MYYIVFNNIYYALLHGGEQLKICSIFAAKIYCST